MEIPGLVGREREVELLRSAVAEVASGQGRFLLLEGEAGIGKTRLISVAGSMSVDSGFTFLVGRAEELESARPFAPFARALGLTGGHADATDPLRRRLLDLLQPRDPDYDPTGSLTPDARFRVLDGIIEVIQRAALSGPTTLALDDLQWADGGSLQALATLVRSTVDLPVLVVAAARPSQRDDEHGRLTEALRALANHHIVLDGLDRDALHELLVQALGGRPGPRLLAEAERVTGNPFLAIELVELLGESELLTRVGDTVDLDRPLPVESAQFALAGVRDLPRSTRDLLEVASVLGRSMTVSTLADVMGTTTARIAGDLAAAIEARVLSAADEELTFRHDLVRDALYHGITAPVRVGMHRDVAKVLSDAGAPATTVAPHYAIGADLGDEEAIEVMLRAANDVVTAAPAISAQWLERAIQLMPHDDPRLEAAAADLSQAHVWSGETRRAEEIARSELARSDTPRHEYRLRTSLAALLFLQGRLGDAAAEFEVLAERGEASGPERGVAYVDAALSRVMSADVDRASRLVESALRLPDGGVPTQAYGRGVKALIEALRGRSAYSLELARRGVQIANGARDHEGHRNLPHFFLSQVQVWADDIEGALRTVHEGRSIAERVGVGWDVPLYHMVAAEANLRGGEWDDAVADAEGGLSYADDLNVHVEDASLLSVLAEVWVGRDELDRTEAALSRADEAQRRSGGHGADHVFRAQALLLEARNQGEEAADILGFLWDQMVATGISLRLVEYGPELTRLLMSTGRRDRAEEVVVELEATESGEIARSRAARHWCRGLLDRDLSLLRRAEAEITQTPAVVDLAMVRADIGALLADEGAADLARRERSAAAEPLRELGATGLLRRHGLSPGERDVSPGGRWDRLTRSERRVVALVARGLSNSEIADELSVSRRTVESHLYHVYPKLGITSRVELAVEAAASLDAD